MTIRQSLALALLLLACASLPSSSATHISKPVLTDPKTDYQLGERIRLHGWVNYSDRPTPEVLLNFKVFSSEGVILADSSFPSDGNGGFMFELETDGLSPGTYNVVITSLCLEVHRQICTHQREAITIDLEDSGQIPSWIKNNARWWAEGTIGDSDFVQGLQYMVASDIIKVSTIPHAGTSQTEVIPDWIRSSAKWWADGLISDSEFVSAIQFLMASGIIIL